MNEPEARSPSPFGVFVRRIREERGYSQAQVSELGGLSDGHLAMIESGARGHRVSRDMVLRIIQGLRATDDQANELQRLAGHPPTTDLPPTPSFVEAVNTDPKLRADQKRALLDLYSTMVR